MTPMTPAADLTSNARRAVVAGTGFYAPDRVVPNSYFNERYGIDIDSFLREKRNIFERRFMAEDQATSDLVVNAAREALKNAGITAEDLDLIVVATDTPDYLSPSTAAVVQHKLGARRAGTFDVNAACAGFVSVMDIGSKYIVADERYRNVLVVGAYGMSKFLNWDDYKIASLFADGAGAAVLQPAPAGSQVGILASHLQTDGQFHDYMGIYAGGTFMPMTHEAIDRKDHQLRFAKRIPTETNSTNWPRIVNAVIDRAGCRLEEVSRFFFTQINIQGINDTLDALGLPHSKSHNIMDKCGYTGSASIGMALADADRKGLLKEGDLLVLMSSGGGVAFAAMALRWGRK